MIKGRYVHVSLTNFSNALMHVKCHMQLIILAGGELRSI